MNMFSKSAQYFEENKVRHLDKRGDLYRLGGLATYLMIRYQSKV